MQVLVYSASWCRDCREAKRFLEKHNISYTEIDIEYSPGAAEEVLRHVGKRAIPQFVVDGKWVQPYRVGQGFLYDEMSELFGVGGATPLHPR
jgi:mycoredoxin